MYSEQNPNCQQANEKTKELLKEITVLPLNEFLATLREKFGADPKKWAFKCPRCGTIQTAEDLLAAGVKKEDLDGYLGFSCIGRFVKGKGCDWTLGGLLQIHKLEVLTPDGQKHPRFEIA
jgi:hypothetical protein